VTESLDEPTRRVLRISFTRLLQHASDSARVRTTAAAEQPRSPLIAIRAVPEPNRPTLVLVHPVGGGVAAYFRLARLLADDQPVYAIENRSGLDRPTQPLESIEEMAASYLELLRAADLGSSLVLGGYSMGGLIAYEMARQLARSGQRRPDLVAIIDTPATLEAAAGEESMSTEDVLTMSAVVCGPLGIDLPLDPDALNDASPTGRVELLIDALRARKVLPAGIGGAVFRQLLIGIQANDRAQRRYRPGRYDGAVLLFRAREHTAVLAEAAGACYDQPAFGWEEFCGGSLEVVPIPGAHLQLLEDPGVRSLASFLQHALDRHTAAPGSTSR
jgi:thioesterase domain-containing protein